MKNKRYLSTSLLFLCLFMVALSACTHQQDSKPRTSIKNGVVVSVRDQKLAVVRNGRKVKSYPVSTSKFGLGDAKGSYRTPIGEHKIAAKIGENQPQGMVFKSRKPTGEVIPPGSHGRDPIVSRILWLDGKETINANAKRRNIYIHGTADEESIGRPSSYGCIRMKTKDVVDIFGQVGTGETVAIETCSLDTYFTPPKPINPPVLKPLEVQPTLVATDAGAVPVADPAKATSPDQSLVVADAKGQSALPLSAPANVQPHDGPIFVPTPNPVKGSVSTPPLPADPAVLPDVHPEVVNLSELPVPVLVDGKDKASQQGEDELSLKVTSSKKNKAKSVNRKKGAVASTKSSSKRSAQLKKLSSNKSAKSGLSASKKKATKKRRS